MTECWIYAGATDRRGYPHLSHTFEGKKLTTMIHRAMYETAVSPIAVGMTLDHLCEVTTCINPEHLEAVSLYENQKRSIRQNVSKSHCKNGHEFNTENTGLDKQGWRWCKQCRRQHINNWYAAKRAAGLQDA